MRFISNAARIIRANRALLVNIGGSVAIKGLAALVQVALLPAYLRYFGDSVVLGVWFTAVTILGWILTFDLGLGNGLRNRLAAALAVRDTTAARSLISSTYVMVLALSVAAGVGGFVAVPHVDWNRIFNVSPIDMSADLLVTMVSVMLGGIVLRFALGLITSIMYALQASALNNLMALLQNGLVLAYLLLASPASLADNVAALTWVNVVSMNLPAAVATIVVFSTTLRTTRPSLRHVSLSDALGTLRLGISFFIIQILGIVVTQNEIFVTQFFSPEAVVDYQKYIRLYGVLVTIFNIAVTPLWSAVTRAIAQGRFAWVRKLLRVIFALIALIGLLFFAIWPVLDRVFRLWLGAQAPVVTVGHALAMAVLGLANVCYFAWSTISYGMGLTRPNLIWIGAGAAVKTPLIYFISRVVHDWSAVVLANVVIIAPYAIILPVLISRRIIAMERDHRTGAT